jgi:hypothetical protein
MLYFLSYEYTLGFKRIRNTKDLFYKISYLKSFIPKYIYFIVQEHWYPKESGLKVWLCHFGTLHKSTIK